MRPQRLIVESHLFVETAVEWILRMLEKTLQARGVCHLMLAGGGTPLPVYAALAKKSLPWHNIQLYFGDERCVPVDHPENNYRTVIQALFPQGVDNAATIHRMRGEIDPETAARDYAAILPSQVDILLLGVGEDGHTASLFPGSTALEEQEVLVLPVIGDKPPPQRLSITPVVIHAAREILVLAEGSSKATAVKRALEMGDVPASLAIQGDWLMDTRAASALSEY